MSRHIGSIAGGELALDGPVLCDLVVRAAAGLRRRGIGPGRVLAVALPSRPDSLVAVLAGLAAGAAVMPVNPRWFPREVAALVDLAQPDLVLGAPEAALPDDANLSVVRVPPAAQPRDVLAPLAGPPGWLVDGTGAGGTVGGLIAEGAELWAPTGGSTGEPRPFVFGAAQLRLWCRPEPSRPATVAVWTELAHPPTLRRVLAALAGGACVALTERWTPRRAAAALAADTPAELWATAAQLGRVFGAGAKASPGPPSPGPLPAPGRIVAFGSRLGPRTRAELVDRLACDVTVLYSCTEAGGWITRPAEATAGACADPFAVGAAAEGVEVVACGPDGAALPPGTAGELHVSGPATALRGGGAAPARRAPAGWATGDLGSVDADGSIRLLGRVADVFTTDGHEVVPAEVEAVLAADPRIRDVAVVPRPHPGRGSVGVAVTVPADPERPPFLADLADRLAALPPWARPAAQAILDDLPLSPTGAVHRRLLSYDEASR